MANSKYEYVRQYEAQDKCLPNTWIVIRLDGRNFHKFSDDHHFQKPNDSRALELMTNCAQHVMKEFKEIVIAYGQSDEYSFVFRKNTTQFKRRASKLVTNVVSVFSSAYVFNWPEFFTSEKLQYPPSFDGRVVLYPTDQNLRDYLSWRQADCHINNLYNTCFWKYVQESGYSNSKAEEALKGTLSSDKNELLFSQFGINYNDIPQIYRKGTFLFWQKVEEKIKRLCRTKESEVEMLRVVIKYRKIVVAQHVDIIRDEFWKLHPEILDEEKGWTIQSTVTTANRTCNSN